MPRLLTEELQKLTNPPKNSPIPSHQNTKTIKLIMSVYKSNTQITQLLENHLTGVMDYQVKAIIKLILENLKQHFANGHLDKARDLLNDAAEACYRDGMREMFQRLATEIVED